MSGIKNKPHNPGCSVYNGYNVLLVWFVYHEGFHASTIYTRPSIPIHTIVLPGLGEAKQSTAVVNFVKCGTYCVALYYVVRCCAEFILLQGTGMFKTYGI